MNAPRFVVYQDTEGLYRWRLVAANGRIVADSGQGYTRRRDAWRAVRVVTSTVRYEIGGWVDL